MKELSICLPTYNRCEIMRETTIDLLEQIRKGGYATKMNVFISNNGSTDSTESYIDKLISDYSDIEIHVNNFKENQGPDANFEYLYSVADGKFVYLKGDDDYIASDGLHNIFTMIDAYPDAGLFIGAIEQADSRRNVKGVIQHVRGIKNSIQVNFQNELEARNYFALSDNILALGSFISCVIVRREALSVTPPQLFKTSNYVHIYYYWNYLIQGHSLVYSTLPICQPVVSEDPTSASLSPARLSWDIRMCVLLADTFFKETSLKADICRVVQRMHSDVKYIPIDQRKEFEEQMYPWMQKAMYPPALLYNIKKRSTSIGLLKYFIASLIPNRMFQTFR